jgi:hypothetical protein
MYESRVLRRVVRPKNADISGNYSYCILRNFVVF